MESVPPFRTDAAEQPFEVLLAYNLMDEEWWWCIERGTATGPHARFSAQPPGCSALAVRQGAHGFPLTAQKVPQHLVVGFAFLVSDHTHSPRERASSRQAARPT